MALSLPLYTLIIDTASCKGQLFWPPNQKENSQDTTDGHAGSIYFNMIGLGGIAGCVCVVFLPKGVISCIFSLMQLLA